MNSNSNLISKIIDMYYNKQFSQNAIAKELNISRTTVARKLAWAKENGYVKVVINYPDEDILSLEKKIEDQYMLRDIVISKSEENKEFIYEDAANYLIRILNDNLTLGITWGSTLKKTVDAMEKAIINQQKKYKNVKIVPLLGTTTPINSSDQEARLANSNFLAVKLGDLLHADSYSLSAPMMVSSCEIKEAFENEAPIKEVMDIAKGADIIVFGIGTVKSDSTLGKLKTYSEAEFEEFKENGAIGEIVGRFYDQNGYPVYCNNKDKIIGISLEEIRKTPIRIGIAAGADKCDAIKGALVGKIANVIITDQDTAKILCVKDNS